MNSYYDRRLGQNEEKKDFVYKSEIGEKAEGLHEDYKHPDDENYSRKGFRKRKSEIISPGKISEEIYDPQSELASFLYMNVTGQIETSNITSTDMVQIKYTFIHGEEWDAIEGAKSSESQFAKRMPGAENVTWNMEFAVGFRTLSPQGWPKLVLELRSPTKVQDVFEVKGYACVCVPTVPGSSTRVAKVFCPVKDNWWNITKSKIFGPKCQVINDPQYIADSEGREVTSVFYGGDIQISFHISQRNFERFGYKTY